MGKLIVFTGNSSSRAAEGVEGGTENDDINGCSCTPLVPTATKDINKAQRMWWH